ncbi:mannan endo-1,4-beta-mannosidase isoform X1 [Aplysia californica]|uniref:Mannan endo-1,4-beta-mannosidase isoform X1 n=1 Tax=Aplysia californica TaxID=6500 RepID=A0ABM0K261_APLCA|nr:mannan endo-1,4-beta-mannosidase isoform X1 [Aplysia californica]
MDKSADAPCNRLYIEDKKFMYNGVHVFLSGGNLPWINYAHDFGDGQWVRVRDQVSEQMRLLHDAGGNSMRLWIHIQGETTPAFNEAGYVTAMDRLGTFLSDFKDMLNLAQSHDILVFPTLWNAAVNQDTHGRLDGLIRDPDKLQSYLDVVLTPLVKQVKGHPALAGWDIINEPEGMIIPAKWSRERCYDTLALIFSGMGWAGKKYCYKEIQRFINWQADAIKSADPAALVTVGVFKPNSCTDSFWLVNHYSDTCLVAAGGRPLGTLDFYEYHSYSWDGIFDGVAVFRHSAPDYKMNKPILVGEFWEKEGGGLTITEMFEYVYRGLYAGAWSWDLVKFGESQRRGVDHIRHFTGNGTIPIHLPREGEVWGELENIRNELEITGDGLENIWDELENTEELENTGDVLENNGGELENTADKLENIRNKLENVTDELESTGEHDG